MGLLLKAVSRSTHPTVQLQWKELECLSRATAAAPDNSDSNYELGAFLLESGKVGAARRYLQRAVDIDPCHVLALDQLAQSYVRDHDLRRAEEIFVKALDVDPDDAPSTGDYVQFLENIRTRCLPLKREYYGRRSRGRKGFSAVSATEAVFYVESNLRKSHGRAGGFHLVKTQ